MIVGRLVKNKNNTYSISVEDKVYQMDEEIILQYRLVEGKEITPEILQEAISENDIATFYRQAFRYCLTYGKSEKEVYLYLKNKGLTDENSFSIIEKLKKANAISDEKLAKELVDSYIRKGNGRLLVEHKLIEHKFSKEIINSSLDSIDMDIYLEGLQRLYSKTKQKYSKENEYIQKMKTKKYLLSRGYTYEDIENIE